jgi:hypothetical protein
LVEFFYKQTGIALLNVECPWHFPGDEKEKKTFANIDRCFSMARRLDPAIDLPQDDWNAVKKFLSDEETDIPDSGFGYKKYLMTFDLAGQWMIDLPGNFYYNVDEGTEVYYDHERTVRSTAYTKHTKNSDDEFVATFFEDNQNAGAEQLDSELNNQGTAIVYYTVDQEAGEEYWILQGVKVMEGGFLLSTICYPTEEYKQWAVDTWNSVRKASGD